jgi:hypothetical protein
MQIKIDDLRIVNFIVPDKIINNIHKIINNKTNPVIEITSDIQVSVEVKTSMAVYYQSPIYLLIWKF